MPYNPLGLQLSDWAHAAARGAARRAIQVHLLLQRRTGYMLGARALK